MGNLKVKKCIHPAQNGFDEKCDFQKIPSDRTSRIGIKPVRIELLMF